MARKIGITFAGLVIAALGLSTGISVTAKTQSIPIKKIETSMSAEESRISKALELKFDGAKVKSIRKTPFNDLYEVVMDKNEIVYTNSSTQFIMIGNLISAEDNRNLTQIRQDELNRIDFNTLPLTQTFKLVKGKGERKIALFEDPNCGYCKLLRKTLESVDNITLYTFVIDILGPDSTEKAKKLLCDQNTAQAWDNWMISAQMPDNEGNCDTGVLQKNKELAVKLGVSGTPTIFFIDGTRIPGAVDKDTLEAALLTAEQSKK